MSLTQTVARIEALLAKATPGEWAVWHLQPENVPEIGSTERTPCIDWSEADYALIAESHNALPLILAELKRLTELAAEAEQVVVRASNLMTVEQISQWEGCRAFLEMSGEAVKETE